MIDLFELRKLVRARVLDLVVATTGSATLAATTDGFTRLAGSFVTEGFEPGMEVYGTGFSTANNAPALVTGVEALRLYVSGGRTAQASSAVRSVVAGLPSRRSWTNVRFEPEPDWPYVEEDMLAGGAGVLRGMSTRGAVEEYPQWVLRWYGLAAMGSGAVERAAEAVRQLFPAGYTFAVGAEGQASVRTDLVPYRGDVRNDKNGYAVCPITMPFRTYSLNPSAS